MALNYADGICAAMRRPPGHYTPDRKRKAMRTGFNIQTQWGTKQIIVFCGELRDLPDAYDILVCSAFWRDYFASRSSLIGALWWDYGVSVEALSRDPELDLKDLGVWVSHRLGQPMFDRIACVEMRHAYGQPMGRDDLRDLYDTLFFSLKKCDQRGIKVRSAAMHVLGTGNQRIPLKTSLMPLLTESISALKNMRDLRTITFFDRNQNKCDEITDIIRSCAPETGASMAFISYSHKDHAVANCIANGLESKGVKSWIDHRMIRNSDYAEDIVKGISNSQAFLILVSEHSMRSNDVLREVRNASVYADKDMLKIWPVLLQRVQYPEKFAYYLAGLDYIDISAPPVEEKAMELCGLIQRKITAEEARGK